jgi:hypothetical protein
VYDSAGACSWLPALIHAVKHPNRRLLLLLLLLPPPPPLLLLWPQVKAVVLRINSPGGSAVASDMIAREVQLLRDAGKPVVACMGDVAASGGYYIAGACFVVCVLGCAGSSTVQCSAVQNACRVLCYLRLTHDPNRADRLPQDTLLTRAGW